MANTNNTHVVTGEVRFSYEHLMKPHTNDPKNPERYSVTMLIPKSDIETKAKIDAGIRAALQNGVNRGLFDKALPLDKLPTPLYDGDGVRADGYTPFGPECKGCWVMTASCSVDRKPEVVDINGAPIVIASQVYSGCYGRVSLDFFPYSAAARKGVGCGLCNAQKTRDGEAIGFTRATASDDFGTPKTGAAADFDPLS